MLLSLGRLVLFPFHTNMSQPNDSHHSWIHTQTQSITIVERSVCKITGLWRDITRVRVGVGSDHLYCSVNMEDACL